MMACCIVAEPVAMPPVYGPPVAEFSPGDITIGTGTKIDFIDLTTDFPTSWQWTINGALFSLARNPSYYFGSPGNYIIGLTASNAYGSSSPITHTIQVI